MKLLKHIPAERLLRLSPEDLAELARIQVEIDEVCARIAAVSAPRVEKTSAWTPEEREAIAEQRRVDDQDAYELGPDGKPLRVEWVPSVVLSTSAPAQPDDNVEEAYAKYTRVTPAPEAAVK